MSYELIKSIKIRDNKVFLASSSNNVCPHHYDEWECTSLSNILQEQGTEAVEVEILKQYENGNFQRGCNKYTRALQVLGHFPEYKNFDWRMETKPGENEERRKSQDFIELLKRALKTQLPKDKFIIKKDSLSGVIYLWKKTKRHAMWHPHKIKAKIFRYIEDAKMLRSCFTGSDDWTIEQI